MDEEYINNVRNGICPTCSTKMRLIFSRKEYVGNECRVDLENHTHITIPYSVPVIWANRETLLWQCTDCKNVEADVKYLSYQLGVER